MKIISFNGHKNILFRRLAKARQDRKLSQQELAFKLQVMGVSIDQQAISKIELDRRIVTDYEAKCFCEVLGVPLSWLLSDDFSDNA